MNIWYLLILLGAFVLGALARWGLRRRRRIAVQKMLAEARSRHAKDLYCYYGKPAAELTDAAVLLWLALRHRACDITMGARCGSASTTA